MAKFYATGTQKLEKEVRSVLITFEDVIPTVNTRLRAEKAAYKYAKENGITIDGIFVSKGSDDNGYIMPQGKNKLKERIRAQRVAELRKKAKSKKK